MFLVFIYTSGDAHATDAYLKLNCLKMIELHRTTAKKNLICCMMEPLIIFAFQKSKTEATFSIYIRQPLIKYGSIFFSRGCLWN